MLARTVAWLSTAALLCGCVTVPEFRALEREVSDLKAGRGSGGAGPLPDGRLAELGSEVSELRDEVARLRGAVEEARNLAQEAIERAEVSRASGGGKQAPAAVPVGGGGVGGDDDDEAPLALTDEVKSYEEAFRLYRNDEYEAAIDRFKAFLQTYPSSDYADNALFWLGECHFKIGEHEQAVLAFDDVAKRYPEGNKVPDALYRQGIALLEIGKQTDQEATYRGAARQIFERLVSDYPDSDRVPEARRQLEKLGQ